MTKYLYTAETVRTVLAIDGYPVLTQTPFQSVLQHFAAVSALQEALPLLTATVIVGPQSLQPLWKTHGAWLQTHIKTRLHPNNMTFYILHKIQGEEKYAHFSGSRNCGIQNGRLAQPQTQPLRLLTA